MSPTLIQQLQRFGFDDQRLVFAFRTALAAFLSIVIAHAIGLEHPQWAAMTVWASSQPLREHLLERSLWRFLGTISGVIVGILLMLLANTHPAFLVLGLALWVGLCGAISLLQRGLVSYGTTLAGYSAAMVSLLSTSNPDNVWLLGLDRFLTVFVGVITAVVIGYFFTPKIQSHPIRNQLHHLTLDSLNAVLKHINRPEKNDFASGHVLLQKMALLDEQLDAHAIGSLSSRRKVKKARQLVLAQLNLMVFLQNHPALNASPALQQQLQQQLNHLQHEESLSPLSSTDNTPESVELIALINLVIGAYQQCFHAETDHATSLAHMNLHRNWMGALHTFIRSASVLGAVGVVWLITDWSVMPFMMLGLSVMLSVFVGFENPAWFLRYVTMGQVLGAVLAVSCVWLVWQPFAQSDWQMIAFMLPFMLFGALVFAFKRTMLASFDAIMVMLILLQPHHPVSVSFAQSVATAASVVMGPIIAMFAFKWIFPAHPEKRLQHLMSMVRFELRGLCQSQASTEQLIKQRNRLVHSLLKAQRINDKLPQPNPQLSRQLLQYLNQAELILSLQRTLPETSSTSTQRLMRALLQAWQKPHVKPAQVNHIISVLQQRIPSSHPLHALLAFFKHID